MNPNIQFAVSDKIEYSQWCFFENVNQTSEYRFSQSQALVKNNTNKTRNRNKDSLSDQQITTNNEIPRNLHEIMQIICDTNNNNL